MPTSYVIVFVEVVVVGAGMQITDGIELQVIEVAAMVVILSCGTDLIQCLIPLIIVMNIKLADTC